MGKQLKHLGYYNNVEDLKKYANMSADDIVADVFNKVGDFRTANDNYIIDEEDLVIGTMKITTNEKYAIVDDLPIDMSLLGKPNVCDFFIDIYEIVSENVA